MDKAMYDKGLAVRRKVLGDEYVDAALKNVDDFNAPLQEILITRERDVPLGLHAGALRQMKAVKGVEEEKSAHALIKIFAAASKTVQRFTLRKQIRS